MGNILNFQCGLVQRLRIWGDTDLLRRDVKAHSPQVHFAVGVDAGQDKEDARAPRAAGPQSPQTENNRSFIFLYYLFQHKLLV